MCRRCISFFFVRHEANEVSCPLFSAIYRPSERTTPTLVLKSWPANSSVPRLVGSNSVFSSHISGQTRNHDCGCLPETLLPGSGFSAAT